MVVPSVQRFIQPGHFLGIKPMITYIYMIISISACLLFGPVYVFLWVCGSLIDAFTVLYAIAVMTVILATIAVIVAVHSDLFVTAG